MTTTTQPTEYITEKELAQRLGVHQATITRWHQQGILPKPLRFGKRLVRWRRAAMQKFLDEMEG